MNAAYEEPYLLWRNQCTCVFCPDCRVEQRPGTGFPVLDGGWRLRADFYEGRLPDCLVHGSEYELLDSHGDVFYRWRNINNDGEFCQILHHKNGRDYLIFRCDLYGYSVLDLSSGKDFHYMPAASFPDNVGVFSETFIWTGVSYDEENSLLAVDGCYWACPSSVMILDFSTPMTANENWMDLRLLIDPDYERYDDIEAGGWGTDGSLAVQVFPCETSGMERLVFTPEELNLLLTGVSKLNLL